MLILVPILILMIPTLSSLFLTSSFLPLLPLSSPSGLVQTPLVPILSERGRRDERRTVEKR